MIGIFSFAYSTYSKQNCQSECEAKVIYQRCKCIMYYMPLMYTNASICGKPHGKCLKKIPTNATQSGACGCLPACSELTYSASMSFARLLNESWITTTNGLLANDLAVLHAYFPMNVLRTYERREHVTFTDFLCE